MALTTAIHRRHLRPKSPPRRTGFALGGELPVTMPGEAMERPPRPAWISDALLAETIEVWTEAYGRPVGEVDAIEILVNVGRLAEALLEAKREMRK